MLIAAGPNAPIVISAFAALVAAVLWLVARVLSRSPGQRLALLLLLGLAAIVGTAVLVAMVLT
jgi:hypothetical protein